ncbi:hypothetical protein PXH59_07300 [Xenorhabdus sp. SF857]|uniref:hypothetical protein n=1 Tax=Xenorhabdus bakwenae TaxID=3026967 RepID=UPI0025581DB3|nr:hypothetical protein [Xenorhabdus sp. SF857]WFQ80897.1 hypothetical protein PXH59_07300 [Xenorhabdus sp. SF857]
MPRGTAYKNPVHVRFSDEEFKELDAIAIREGRSKSSMVHVIYMSAVQNFR